MASKLFYTWQAEEDLAAIYRLIADSQLETAREFLRSIEDRCESLVDFPYQGRARDDLSAGLRILPYSGSVVIAYRITDKGVVIARVFYGGRDYERLLG